MIRRLLRGRKYKSGTGWCFWRWTDVDSEYILRLHVLKTPWFAICLHWINKPDPEPYLHDHPVSFLSLILRGWYEELRTLPGNSGPRSNQPGSPFDRTRRRWFNWIRASHKDRHSICEVSPGGALTLCLMGPKTRDWGFHLSNGRWMMWKDYYAEKREGRQP